MIILKIYFKLANKYNIIDIPNERSSHENITIRGGGVIFPISILLWYYFTGSSFTLFVTGLCLISVISFLDDCITLTNSIRILVHVISVGLLLYQLGFEEYNWFYWVTGFVLIIGWVNAVNFMDGINGITVLYSLSVLASCYYINTSFPFIDSYLMEYTCMGLVVFGVYNVRKKAKSFAGDVGSVSVAFIIAFILMSLIVQSSNWKYVLLVSVYGVDTVVSIIQRLLRKENIFNAHRSHLYQHLANEGKHSHVTISVIYAGIQLCLNTVLIVYIIPKTNHLTAIMYLVAQGLLYLLIKTLLKKKLNLIKSVQ